MNTNKNVTASIKLRRVAGIGLILTALSVLQFGYLNFAPYGTGDSDFNSAIAKARIINAKIGNRAEFSEKIDYAQSLRLAGRKYEAAVQLNTLAKDMANAFNEIIEQKRLDELAEDEVISELLLDDDSNGGGV